jgi:hypothetical protein
MLMNGGDRFEAIAGFGDDFDAALGLEDASEPGPDELLIVGDDHAQCHRQLSFKGSRAWTANPPSALRPASSAPP